jgi:hypothetical protein
MKHLLQHIQSGLLLLTLLLSACTVFSAQSKATPTSINMVVLRLTGLVDNEMEWTSAELNAMPTTEASVKNNIGQVQTFSGLLASDLVNLITPNPGATTLFFIGEAGSVITTVDGVKHCNDCLLIFNEQGGISLTFPGFADPIALIGLKEIQIK